MYTRLVKSTPKALVTVALSFLVGLSICLFSLAVGLILIRLGFYIDRPPVAGLGWVWTPWGLTMEAICTTIYGGLFVVPQMYRGERG